MNRTCEIKADWDAEAGVWVAESQDVPGLVAEAESLSVLAQKLRILVPELLELNGALAPGEKVVKLLIRAHHEETTEVAVAP